MVDLSDLRNQVLSRADMENSNFVSTSELNYYINRSAEELYELLVSKYEDYYVEELNITISPPNDGYSIPNGIYKLRGVDILKGSRYINVNRFNFENRNVHNQTLVLRDTTYDVKYKLIGSNVKFIPSENAAGQYKLWYVPRYTELTSDNDELPIDLQQWQDYIVIDAAIKCLQKEESDVSVLAMAKVALVNRINNSASNRDINQSETVSATRLHDEDELWFFNR